MFLLWLQVWFSWCQVDLYRHEWSQVGLIPSWAKWDVKNTQKLLTLSVSWSHDPASDNDDVDFDGNSDDDQWSGPFVLYFNLLAANSPECTFDTSSYKINDDDDAWGQIVPQGGHFDAFSFPFISCLGQLNSRPCHSLTHSLTN